MSSRCEAHVDAQWGHNTRCVGRVSVASVGLEKVRLSVGQVKTEKVRLSGREHLAGVQREIKTRCVGQVKTGKVSLFAFGSLHSHCDTESISMLSRMFGVFWGRQPVSSDLSRRGFSGWLMEILVLNMEVLGLGTCPPLEPTS